jgi:hypothetical protein
VDATTSESSADQLATADAVRHISASTICGGVMGISCLAGQVCIDDPSDKCDPAVRGTDCMGICVVPTGVSCGGFTGSACPVHQACISGQGTTSAAPHGADLLGVCAKSPACGGIGHLQCPATYTCIDDPADSCDPAKHGVDCMGLCVLQ